MPAHCAVIILSAREARGNKRTSYSLACARSVSCPFAGGRALELEESYALSTIIFFTSAIAFAGFNPFGQTFAQFMMVWQR